MTTLNVFNWRGVFSSKKVFFIIYLKNMLDIETKISNTFLTDFFNFTGSTFWYMSLILTKYILGQSFVQIRSKMRAIKNNHSMCFHVENLINGFEIKSTTFIFVYVILWNQVFLSCLTLYFYDIYTSKYIFCAITVKPPVYIPTLCNY